MNTQFQEACQERRARIANLSAMQDKMEAIIERLPNDEHLRIVASNEWIQICSATREQVVAVLSALNAGKWEKELCTMDNKTVNYKTLIDGIEVTMHNAEPPTSCRIETQEIEVPAHKQTVIKLICA